MGLVGENKHELAKSRPQDIQGEVVVCKMPTSTTTKGREYRVRGHHCYINKYSHEGDHWWEWDEFITIKNDEGYTIKVNKIRFERKSVIIKKQRDRERYENNALNILSEAHQLTQQKYT